MRVGATAQAAAHLATECLRPARRGAVAGPGRLRRELCPNHLPLARRPEKPGGSRCHGAGGPGPAPPYCPQNLGAGGSGHQGRHPRAPSAPRRPRHASLNEIFRFLTTGQEKETGGGYTTPSATWVSVPVKMASGPAGWTPGGGRGPGLPSRKSGFLIPEEVWGAGRASATRPGAGPVVGGQGCEEGPRSPPRLGPASGPSARQKTVSLKNTLTDCHTRFPLPHHVHLSGTPKTGLRRPGLTHSEEEEEEKKKRTAKRAKWHSRVCTDPVYYRKGNFKKKKSQVHDTKERGDLCFGQ